MLLHGLHGFLHGVEVGITLSGWTTSGVKRDVTLDWSQWHEEVIDILFIAAEWHSTQVHAEQILFATAEEVIAGEVASATATTGSAAEAAVVASAKLATSAARTEAAITSRASVVRAGAVAVASKASTTAAVATTGASSRAVIGASATF